MATTVICKCKCCKQPFEARTADRARGWAKFCSKSCKAKKQENNMFGKSKGRRSLPRPDGVTPMKFKTCFHCGEPAVNGVYTASGIEWQCARHRDDTHPFSSDALGQW